MLRRLLPLLLVVTAACAVERDPDEIRLYEAKQCLRQANFLCARERFAAIERPTGRLALEREAGLALTRWLAWLQDESRVLVDLAEWLSGQRLEVVAAAEFPGAPAATSADVWGGASVVARQVYNLFYPSYMAAGEVGAELANLLDRYPRFAVTYESVPVMIGDLPLAILSGSWTEAEFRFIHGLVALARFAYAALLALDPDVPIAETIRYALTLPECTGPIDDRDERRCWGRLLAFALHNAPNALRLEPERGAELQAAARTHLADFFGRQRRFLEALARADRPGDAILRRQGRPDGGAWVYLRFAEPKLALAELEALVRGESSLAPPYDFPVTTVRFVAPAGLESGLRAAASHLATGAPARITATAALLPGIAVAGDFLLQSEVVLNLVRVVGAGISPEFARTLDSLVADLRRLLSDYGTADATWRLLERIVPGSLQLDLHRVLSDERYLRRFLPAAVSEPTTDGELPVWSFLIEWECDPELVHLGACPADVPLADVPHFAGTPYAIPADGIPGRLPYTAFPTGHFDGFLWFDPWEVDPRYPRGVTQPDLATLTGAVQLLGHRAYVQIEGPGG